MNMSNMQILMSFNIVFLLLFGCKSRSGLDAVEYVKVYTTYDADSLTTFNKGVTTFQFFYLDTDNDSLIFRYSHIGYERNDSVFPMERITLTGKVSDTVNLDKLNRLLVLLQHHSDGNVNKPSRHDNWIYCGPSYIVEIKDAKGLHNYNFTLDDNDTLDEFSYFFERIPDRQWGLHQVDNSILNGDSVVVDLYKRLGIYDSLPAPFLGKVCEMEVDFSAIDGTWRSINTLRNVDSNTYYRLIMASNHNYHFEQFKKGTLFQSSIPGKFKINQNDTSFELNWKNEKRKYLITKLTSDCFEYKEPDRRYVYKYSKVQ